MKQLYLGDPHVMASNIEESERLLLFVLESAQKHKVNSIVILGDLANNHAIVRLEVTAFWTKWLKKLCEEFKVIALCGNHDMRNNDDNSANFLAIFNEMGIANLTIVDRPVIIDEIGYLPYIHDNAEFISRANSMYVRTLVSHTTYDGAEYENGHYAPDGVDPLSINCQLMISGHIHARKKLETVKSQTVVYSGTARWLTASDANQPKGLWLADIEPSGKIISEEYLDTSHVCTPILSIQWKEGDNQPEFPDKARVSMELIGSSDWVSKQKSALKGSCSIKTKITDPKKTSNRRAGNSFKDYLENHHGKKGSKLIDFFKELKIV